jgi:hypothetical protein
MRSHIVCSAISLTTAAEIAGVTGTLKLLCLLERWMIALSAEVYQMFLESLLLEKDFITMLTLVLTIFIVLIQVHTQR